jgi:hypothetical protein
MEMVPATSSDSPPYITTLVVPRADRPAVRANGTVRPSEKPIVAAEMRRASKRDGLEGEEEEARVAVVAAAPPAAKSSSLLVLSPSSSEPLEPVEEVVSHG